MATKPQKAKSAEIELRADGWKRFEKAVDAAVKSGPKHRQAEGKATMSVFAKSDPAVEKTYAAILKAVSKFGNVRAEEKKTSIHLCAKTGFAGVHPRKSAVLLNIRSAAPIKSRRIRKLEQVSANRFHNEMLLESPKDIDAEVIGWLKSAYALSVG